MKSHSAVMRKQKDTKMLMGHFTLTHESNLRSVPQHIYLGILKRNEVFVSSAMLSVQYRSPI